MSLLSPNISPFRVTAILLWLFTAVGEAMTHGLILANRLGDHPPDLQRAYWAYTLLIALGVGLWRHSKAAAALYITLTSVAALGAMIYAFMESDQLIFGLMGALSVLPYYVPSWLMIQRWSDLSSWR